MQDIIPSELEVGEGEGVMELGDDEGVPGEEVEGGEETGNGEQTKTEEKK